MFDYPHWLSILAHIHLKFFVGNDRVDIYYRVAGSGYEPSIICYMLKLSYGMRAWIIGFHRHPSASKGNIDNRLQCTVSWIGLNGFDKKCLVPRGCQKDRPIYKG